MGGESDSGDVDVLEEVGKGDKDVDGAAVDAPVKEEEEDNKEENEEEEEDEGGMVLAVAADCKPLPPPERFRNKARTAVTSS